MSVRSSAWRKAAFLIAAGAALFFSCSTDSGSSDDGDSKSEIGGTTIPETPAPSTPENGTPSGSGIIAGSYFWGIWQRMDNGANYVIGEKSIAVAGETYAVTESSETALSASTLGTFTKQTESVMLRDSIPYFRKGGTNLAYTMKLVGFEESVARAASSASLAGYTVTGTSENYGSYSSSATSEDDGTVTLKAPVSGDVQTVTVTSGGSTIAVVPGITVETSGSNMGTIPISEAGQYSLKVTGTIAENEKDDGYLYGGGYKSYPMTLTITNVSEVVSATSACSIAPADSVLSLSATDGTNLDLIPISTLKADMTKNIQLTVKCGSLSEAYIDTGLNIAVTNLKTGKTWVDFVPLRFHRGLVPVTVAAKSTENNADAALNGFVIYPDGNSQFFAVPDGGYKTLYVPSFGASNPCTLAFSGATVEDELSASTEMFYTVVFGSTTKQDVIVPSTLTVAQTYYAYGEPNDTESNAFVASRYFEAYLGDGDIDFFSVNADCEEVIFPSGRTLYAVNYNNSDGSVLRTISVESGESLSDSDLNTPQTAPIGYVFDGWYIGSYKMSAGYTVNANITLTAKWKPIEYNITYNLNGGTNAATASASYTVESGTITLPEPTRKGYSFKGWYTSEDFSGNVLTQIAGGSMGDVTLYAKWEIVTYSIVYETDVGINSEENPVSYTANDDVITLFAPKTVTAHSFIGWYETEDFTGNIVTQIPANSIGDRTYYAKWFYGFSGAISQIMELDLATLTDEYTIIATDTNIWEQGWQNLAIKIATANNLINLDLSQSTGGINEIKGDTSGAVDSWTSYFAGSKLKSIILPQYVRSIGLLAFDGCTHLVSVEIQDGVTIIGTNAFSGCSRLTSISLPSGVTSIGAFAFSGCTQLASIDIPSSVETIESEAFLNCTSLESIVIPKKVTEIGTSTFDGCSCLASVTIQSGVTSIGVNAFVGCTALTNLALPSSVKSIKSYAFFGCSNLYNISYSSLKTWWNASVNKDANWNSGSAITKVICTDGEVEL